MAMKWPPIDWKTNFYGYLVGPGVFHVNVEMFFDHYRSRKRLQYLHLFNMFQYNVSPIITCWKGSPPIFCISFCDFCRVLDQVKSHQKPFKQNFGKLVYSLPWPYPENGSSLLLGGLTMFPKKPGFVGDQDPTAWKLATLFSSHPFWSILGISEPQPQPSITQVRWLHAPLPWRFFARGFLRNTAPSPPTTPSEQRSQAQDIWAQVLNDW